VISINVQLSRSTDEKRRLYIMDSIQDIDQVLNILSEESLRDWRTHYNQR